MATEKERLSWMDNLRAFATISIIFLHVSYPLVTRFDTTPGGYSNWWVGNIYDSSVRFAVPVFLMLTGALLLGRPIPMEIFFKRRFTRLLLPLLFWSIVYMLISFDYKSAHTANDIVHWAYLQLANGASQHMWYVYMIIGIYLFVPFINKWITHSTEPEILLFLSLWIFVILKQFIPFSYFSVNIDFSHFSGYLGYLVLGYYLSVKQFKTKYINTISACLLIAGVSITIFGTYHDTAALSDFDNFYYNFLSINVLMVAAGIFLLFKNYKSAKKISVISKIGHIISKHSYGIYLVHILILTSLNTLKINCFFITPVLAVPVTATLCLVISLLLVWLISKIPYGHYISG